MNGNPIQMLMQMMNGGNPQQSVQNMVKQNPQYNAVLNQMKQSGMPPKDYVMQYAKQHNIDINPILDMLRKNGMKF